MSVACKFRQFFSRAAGDSTASELFMLFNPLYLHTPLHTPGPLFLEGSYDASCFFKQVFYLPLRPVNLASPSLCPVICPAKDVKVFPLYQEGCRGVCLFHPFFYSLSEPFLSSSNIPLSILFAQKLPHMVQVLESPFPRFAFIS